MDLTRPRNPGLAASAASWALASIMVVQSGCGRSDLLEQVIVKIPDGAQTDHRGADETESSTPLREDDLGADDTGGSNDSGGSDSDSGGSDSDSGGSDSDSGGSDSDSDSGGSDSGGSDSGGSDSGGSDSGGNDSGGSDEECSSGVECGSECCASEDELCHEGLCFLPCRTSDDCIGNRYCVAMECLDATNPCSVSSDCEQEFYCENSLAAAPTTPSEICHNSPLPLQGRCLPAPEICAHQAPLGVGCVMACELASSVAPELRHQWSEAQIMMTPAVTQLDDDNCDGIVDGRDIPDIIVTTFEGTWTSFGTVRAFSIIDGILEEKWATFTTEGGEFTYPGRQIAAGDLDGNPGAEVATCTVSEAVRVYSGTGEVLWTSPTSNSCFMPSIADIDGNGWSEVITHHHILNGQTDRRRQGGLYRRRSYLRLVQCHSNRYRRRWDHGNCDSDPHSRSRRRYLG